MSHEQRPVRLYEQACRSILLDSIGIIGLLYFFPNMPNNKKKKGKAKSATRQANQASRAAFKHEHAPHFSSLLLSARQEYAKGRSYEAVTIQKEALEYGKEHLGPNFDTSLTKAHALVELALSLSACTTGFALRRRMAAYPRRTSRSIGTTASYF